jgi:RNA polymerase sigma-70 factor (ECF subfamily)
MQEKEDSQSQYFIQLFLKSQRRLYGYVMAVIHNPVEADDIVQEAASLMWKKFDEYKPGTDFTAWAISVARFKIFRYLREKKSQQQKFSQKTMDIIEQLESEDVVNEDTRIGLLRQCIQKLRDTERRILELRYEEGATLKTLAGRLGVNVNTLYSQLSKIHLMLLNCIKKATVE